MPTRRTLVVVAVLLIAGLGWWTLTGRVLDRVEVGAGGWTCRGTDLQPARAAGVRAPAPALRPGMTCRTRLRVSNGAGVALTLRSLLVPVVGDRAGPGVRLVTVDGRAPRPGVDAVVDFGEHLAGDAGTDLTLTFAYRHDGCTPPGTFWVQPRVRVSAWGRSREVVGSTPFAFRGTSESDCWGKLSG